MAASSYDEALRRLLVHEGGYSNLSADPGGPTNFGITLTDYRKYIGAGGTAADVRAMTVFQAKNIYREKYWNAVRGDELPAGVDYAVFDYGVNSGVSRAIKVLQRVVGVAADGKLGPATLAALTRRDPRAVVTAISDERLAFLKSLRTWPVFGTGWGRRVAEVRAYALRLAGHDQIAPAPSEPAKGKAVIPPPSVAKTAAAPAAVAVAAAGATWRDWLVAHPVTSLTIIVAMVAAAVAIITAINRNHQSQQDEPHASAVPVPEAV